jgi:amino acid adenylation domain-containing protein
MSPDDRGRLSPGERALWSLQRLHPASGAYNLAGAFRIADLDPAILRRALRRLVARHPALRTTYPAAAAGEPFRAVHDALEPDIAEEDLGPGAGGAVLRGRLEAEAVRPFDPAAGPLLRVRIFNLPGAGRAVLFVLHHLIADFASLALALRELGSLYSQEIGESRGGAAPEGSPPPSYADWVAALEAGLATPRAERLREHWRQHLAGPPPVLDLPADRRRLAGPASGAGDTRSARLDAAATARLLALGRERGATLFAVLLAGFQLLLHRLDGQAPDEVWIGVPTAGRTAARWAGTMGYFVNPVVMRGRPGAAPSAGALVAAARDESRSALAHRDWPFPLLAADLQPVREAGLPPLFQAMLTLHRTRHAEEEAMALLALGEGGGRACLGGLCLETLPLRFHAAQLELALAAAVVDGELRLRLAVDADQLDGSTAARLLSHLTTLLAALGEAPETAPGDLPLFTAAERHQLLAEWGEGPPAAAPGPTVLSLIAARAAEAPDEPAVLFAGRVVRTRGELARSAAALAAKLAGLGAGPGTVVGICLDRSPELVEAVLGVLASGAAYLPLDPAYPRAYLAHVLEDSGVPLVLTRAGLRATLPETRGRVFILPVVPEPPGEAVRLAPASRPDAPAYLLYTSGSTGRPKGIPVLHRSLSAYLDWVLAEPLAAIDGLPFVTSLGFDASLKQLFAPLLAGFPVRLVDDETAHRPEKLLAELRAPGRLALNCIPSLWREILDTLEDDRGPGAEPLGLVRLLLGGEGFDRGLLERTVHRLPGVEVWNLYGPTEATANAAAARLVPPSQPLIDPIDPIDPSADTDRGISAGRPLPGVRLYVADIFLRPLPAGAAGELLLGGAGVAPGYWRRPDLTAARFIPDPFSGLPGERLYRTGDRARFPGAGGAVELLGRTDLQVKLRGLRIEPREIEAALLAHPEVAECVAGADARGRRLIAWVVPRPAGRVIDPGGWTGALRRHLESRLPAAMVPAAFIVLDALPRTPTGKVDRAALAANTPEPVVPAASSNGSGLSQTPAEEVLAGLWAEVLGVAAVAPGDDFFALGGDSLLAARLLSWVRNAFGVDLPLSALFAAPTVAGLAAAVAEARRQGALDRDLGALPVPRVVPMDRDARLFLSFAQERLWFLAQWMPDSPAYNIPAAVGLDGVLDVPALAAALGEIVRRHEILRTTYTAIAGLPVQIPCAATDAWTPLVPLVDLSALAAPARDEAVAARSREEARRPFDLHHGPVLRACLLRLAPTRHVLLVSLHHIASDGWSMGVLLGELTALYRSFREGRPSPLPPLAVQYADFAAWQRQRVEEGDASQASDLAWWRAFLAGAPADIDIPADRQRPAWSIHRGALAPFRLDPAQTGRLRTAARHGGATLFMILLAAFETLLARLSGATDLVVGAAVDQRTPEVEGLIGLFVNLLALRGDLSGDPTFADLLARTRKVALDAHDHRDLPFERLVAALDPVRHPGRNPLFQVAFSLQSAPLREAVLPGLALDLADLTELDTGTARFDLTVFLRELGGAGGVTGNLEFSTDLFDAATIGRFLGGFANLLAAVAESGAAELPLSRLPLLSPGERQQILEVWTESADRRPRDGSLGGLFLRQAARSPQAVALVAGEEEMSYGELAHRAGGVAGRLRALGAGPDVPVALCLERSPEMVVGMLGIVLAGAAYVPLDLGYPVERLAWMLEDSGARIVVTRGVGLSSLSAALGRLLEAGGLRIVDLDQPGGADHPPGVDAHPADPADPANLAYIVFTSGSTGRPKGVAATHRGVTRLMVDPGYVDLGPAETFLQLAPVSFDASTFEIWGALLNGGRLVLPPPGPVALRELAETLRRQGVTTLFLTTGLFHQMVDQEAGSLAGLRQLLFGGDTASMIHVRRALDLLPGVRLIHAYGPTEATTFATCRTVTWADAMQAALSLGRPVPRTRACILDAGLEPVPAGVPGELWLGGDGLARGYLGRPDLTAERFVPSPFQCGEEGGERLYRTGDLARWLPGDGRDVGDIGFLGRVDRQVKIRGFRVEPAEVEAALERHPGIAACVVQPRGEAEDKRLIAWIVPAGQGQESAPLGTDADLLAWCRERLPPFLLPAAFVRVASLPLDPNGKLDRRGLPEPERSRRAEGFVAPRTPVEEKVAAVWAEVLGLDRVGAEDDFFILGGHSLLATQIVSRLSREFGVEIGLRAFFEEPTVAGLAVVVTREQIRQGDPERMARLLARVRELSADELAELLREERSEPGR